MQTNWLALPAALAAVVALSTSALGQRVDPNDPGILEPVSTAIGDGERRIPHTDQADHDDILLTPVGAIVERDAEDARSLLGHRITREESPNDDMADALDAMADAASGGDGRAMRAAAAALMDILMGTTKGRIYDGFPMLNFRHDAIGDQEPGEYKMKVLRDTYLTENGLLGKPVKIWEVDVNMLYYDGQIDSDTFLLKVPIEAGAFDTVRINYRIYSTEREEFSPTVVLLDRRLPGSVQFPFKGFDSVWLSFGGGDVLDFTMATPPLRLLRGVYTWGWRVHPPRIQFLQPIFETVNAHTDEVELDPQGQSYAYRNRELTLDAIGDAAPEKKMYRVAKAVLDGASPRKIARWLNRDDAGPRGTWQDWADLAEDQRQLPPEAWDILADEGIKRGEFGANRLVTVYMNNEMYGEGPDGTSIAGWDQGERFQVKLINLDDHTHYFRNVDFGPRLHEDIHDCCSAGSHSFEVMNFKGTYGIPKVAEMQWRAGWGFRPHFNVIQQDDVFPRPEDQVELTPFSGGFGETWFGYQWSDDARGGDFRFNPPPFIITNTIDPAPYPLKDEDGGDGLVIGQTTEGMGVAQFCPGDPVPGFCTTDVSQFNPNGASNGPNGELFFPPFLRNPAQGNGLAGDIIPPTAAWKPFLFLNPANGSLFIDDADPGQGFWVDRTYAHGTPIAAGTSLDANVEMPRASGQVFYQFDDLFHDNAIFSPHPKFGDDAIDVDDATEVGIGIDGPGRLINAEGSELE